MSSQAWKKLSLFVSVDFREDPPQIEKGFEVRCPVEEAYEFLVQVHDFVVDKIDELQEMVEDDDEKRVN